MGSLLGAIAGKDALRSSVEENLGTLESVTKNVGNWFSDMWDKILDVGAFSQLLDAAQRSGIVPGSGVIIQVRDCEFRLGRFNKGLQMMETLYTTFIAAESQRNQRLQREEAEIASGRKKISPKDLLAKRAQDNQTTQVVDRTKVRFQRVLEGLRGLLPLEKASNEMD
jgi:phage-related minor tail protein